MNIAVLGGLGIQGRAALADLAASEQVDAVFCADIDVGPFDSRTGFFDTAKVTPVKVDAASITELRALFDKGVDVVIDLLPRQFMETVCLAAMAAGVSVVNTNYAAAIAHLDRRAKDAGIAIMPECGLDPGIDLIVYGEAKRRFDELNVINSYCGGFPARTACNNPLAYKVSWTWEGVLTATHRDSRVIQNGRTIDIPAADQHGFDNIHEIEFPGLGTLEAIPNGDAVLFTDKLGVTPTIRETGRYSLRWPGWSAFWRPLKPFGFLDSKPVPGLPCEVTPIQFLDKLMGPQLQYRADEKDVVAMVNIFEGIAGGRRIRLTSRLFIERNTETGLMAMSQGVGYPASIVAQMIAGGEIDASGVLSPVTDVPGTLFMDALKKRGVVVEEEETSLEG